MSSSNQSDSGTVLVGADLCPIEGNLPFFRNGDAASLFHDLLEEFQAADLVVANLECPLIRKPTPILKTGPTFGESPDCLNGIKAAGIDVLCLANNHILDHGAAGLASTLEACVRAGVATVGAGENLAAARRILVREVGPVRLGIMALAEHEFSIAGPKAYGAYPLDPIDFTRNVRECRDQFDHLLVLYHGGDEFHVPSPRTRDTCRFLVEMGAGTVIVQHPHTFGGIEAYQGGHIVYGQGALVMDEAIYRTLSTFHEGFLVKLTLRLGASPGLEVVPFVQSAPVPGARRLRGEAEVRLRTELDKRSAEVLDDALVETRWRRFCEERKYGYLSSLLGYGRIMAKLNSRGHLSRWLHSPLALARARNVARCETHREAVDTIFELLR